MSGLCVLLVMSMGTALAAEGTFAVHPVGTVVKTDDKTVLEILPKYRDALKGLDGFSHAIVLYWFDRNDTPEKRSILMVHPRGDQRNPLSGVFATRSPVRPNLIGMSVCKIRSIQDGRVFVESIDAFDQTPIIDLKPYISHIDCPAVATVPEWATGSHDGRR